VRSRFHSVIALALALSVFAILVSPFAASELTTLRTPQKLRPTATALPLSLYAPLTAWLLAPAQGVPNLIARVLPGSEVVSLTCARLC